MRDALEYQAGQEQAKPVTTPTHKSVSLWTMLSGLLVTALSYVDLQELMAFPWPPEVAKWMPVVGAFLMATGLWKQRKGTEEGLKNAQAQTATVAAGTAEALKVLGVEDGPEPTSTLVADINAVAGSAGAVPS